MAITHAEVDVRDAPGPAGEVVRQRECNAQAGLYRLLGRCLEAEVDDALLEVLRAQLRQPLAEAGLTFDDAFFNATTRDLLDTLAEEYSGLFVAPGGVSPYASVFETGRMFQEPADRAERAYRLAGLAFNRRMSGEFADHIGTMLTFVGLLYQAEADALEREDSDAARARRSMREGFVLAELAAWGPGWCRRAREAAMHVFYQQLLMLAESVLWFELESLADRKRLKELAALNSRAPIVLDYDADFRKASGL